MSLGQPLVQSNCITDSMVKNWEPAEVLNNKNNTKLVSVIKNLLQYGDKAIETIDPNDDATLTSSASSLGKEAKKGKDKSRN